MIDRERRWHVTKLPSMSDFINPIARINNNLKTASLLDEMLNIRNEQIRNFKKTKIYLFTSMQAS